MTPEETASHALELLRRIDGNVTSLKVDVRRLSRRIDALGAQVDALSYAVHAHDPSVRGQR